MVSAAPAVALAEAHDQDGAGGGGAAAGGGGGGGTPARSQTRLGKRKVSICVARRTVANDVCQAEAGGSYRQTLRCSACRTEHPLPHEIYLPWRENEHSPFAATPVCTGILRRDRRINPKTLRTAKGPRRAAGPRRLVRSRRQILKPVGICLKICLFQKRPSLEKMQNAFR